MLFLRSVGWERTGQDGRRTMSGHSSGMGPVMESGEAGRDERDSADAGGGVGAGGGARAGGGAGTGEADTGLGARMRKGRRQRSGVETGTALVVDKNLKKADASAQPLDPRAKVGQELNRRNGGGVFVGIESVHAALNEFECCRSLRGWFFFLRSSFFVRSS
jgi:hypothetical protein